MSLTHLQIRDALHQPCRLRLHSLKRRLGRLLAHLMRAGSGEGVISGTAELTATQNEAPCSSTVQHSGRHESGTEGPTQNGQAR